MAKPKYMQDEREIAAFAEVIRREGIRSYLEIGSKYGGSLLPVAAALQPRSKIVCVDLPNGTGEWETSSRELKGHISRLNVEGHDASVIWGDSTDPKVVDEVKDRGPYEAVFIDANHTLPYVTRDWSTYKGMATKLVAFHDIGWSRGADFKGTPINVPEFWNSIKDDYRHEEFKFCPTGRNNGIGVLWLS